MSHPEREIRAHFDAHAIRVYQAYSDAIADSALKHQTFISPPFSMNRMTWIKPSFLWMMYRSGWGRKDDGQKRILAIDITHEGFQWAMDHSCPSHPEPGTDHDQWKAKLAISPVRIQWDPERDLHHNPLAYRAIQIGLSGEAVTRYARDWIRKVTEVTDLAHTLEQHVRSGDLETARSLLPKEAPYTLDETTNWNQSREVVRLYGLPPKPEFLPAIRERLDQEIANLQEGGPHEYLRSLCALLWSNGDPVDAVRIARAKFIDFDAMCMVDVEFLICGDLQATTNALMAAQERSTESALKYLNGYNPISREEVLRRIEREREQLTH